MRTKRETLRSLDKIDKIPPANIEAEQALLGSMLLEEEARNKAIEEVSPDDFYKESHCKIFKAITGLFEKNESCDLVTLTNRLKSDQVLEKIGGSSYLTKLIDVVPSAANIEHYIKIVRDNFILRQLIKNSNKIINDAYQSDDVERSLDEAEKVIFKIGEYRERKGGIIPFHELIHQTIETIGEAADQKGYITGLPSGFGELDGKTSGFQPSDIIIVASRPSVGKTSLATNLASYLGVKKNIPLVFFSLEMSKEQLAQRMLCTEARVNLLKLRTGFSEKNDWPNLTMAASKLQNAPIFIDDSPALSVLEIRTKVRRLVAKEGIKFVIVDYLQLMQTKTRIENRQQEITEISASLKALAKELKIPIMALSQLRRAAEEHPRPRLADLRESGAIEQDADLVLLLYREEETKKNEEGIEGEEKKGSLTELIIAKQRNGPTGTINLTFIKEYTKFEPYSPRGEVSG
ncbi:MAG: replicative DNA helicase [bacterium (Candidatus Ratteibacteria) CG_4_10_14_3_um_filter_41_18]|uniref:Replicative DNA helicase n=4 Tax=Candidatus Ratteibacteria TaxID=2979319 RepID=A0A2M7YFZ4_9BACT|nr:MAG: replicative DNA helicase [Candidatus Omnitrophica bacterium CG1_02_41_171]PIV64623.1 MAG: replicative DNA helicase [bacterium (Candidatus Ratteibacteria) CG01_land_8_20_14_3_00_40_19]PIW32912.1 MAG: replicative DNA helicase [bacterium (Candidatus Ratteibacteria) CG15_BIG_FIL_POST_REV_8_21_14_020_41_12]PIW74525.1 MAG: replicative DNA helicase [bacterium (Candidatus Ratteibacteria) CG_4_8_14_3_um_filter_41_36]PIX77825.1 MAG: replicative DNA helicase [bacterium (Candidatus Ratteibacteria) 